MLARDAASPSHHLEHHAATGHYRPIDIVPFEAWHLNYIDVRPEQWAFAPILTEGYGQALARQGGGFTAFEGMEVIAVAGIALLWPGRAMVWALMTPRMPSRIVVIHRAVFRYLRHYRCARVECVIDPVFAESVEWARRLGFHYESTMPKYAMDGRSMDLYVRLEE
jgi:hypothetical protein